MDKKANRRTEEFKIAGDSGHSAALVFTRDAEHMVHGFAVVAAPGPPWVWQAGGVDFIFRCLRTRPSHHHYAGFLLEAEALDPDPAANREAVNAALTGNADPHALVEALASSQNAVETVATLRDRVVEAYQEILRMPV